MTPTDLIAVGVLTERRTNQRSYFSLLPEEILTVRTAVFSHQSADRVETHASQAVLHEFGARNLLTRTDADALQLTQHVLVHLGHSFLHMSIA